MAGRPPMSSEPSNDDLYGGDPFANRPRQTQFQEPTYPSRGQGQPRPYESNASLPQEFGQQPSEYHADDDYVEKLPLTAGQDFSGGFYPPG